MGLSKPAAGADESSQGVYCQVSQTGETNTGKRVSDIARIVQNAYPTPKLHGGRELYPNPNPYPNVKLQPTLAGLGARQK